MTEQWQELKETIIEMRDNDGTATQQEACRFLVNLMDVLEKHMEEPQKSEDAVRKALDEIKAEIASSDNKWWMGYDAMIKEAEVFRIIDKHKAGSEDKE